MKRIGLFVDTSGWGNLVDRKEPFHKLAKRLYLRAIQQKRSIITTNYILTELVSLLHSRRQIPRPAMVQFIDRLKQAPGLEIVHVDVALDDDGWQLLQSRLDKEWSLVDCVSFALMNQRGITEALTSDHHFEQAGFVRLLK